MNYLPNVLNSLKAGAKVPFQYFGGRVVEAFAGPIDKRIERIYTDFLLLKMISQYQWTLASSMALEDEKVRQLAQRVSETSSKIIRDSDAFKIDSPQDILETARNFLEATQKELNVFYLINSKALFTEAEARVACVSLVKKLPRHSDVPLLDEFIEIINQFIQVIEATICAYSEFLEEKEGFPDLNAAFYSEKELKLRSLAPLGEKYFLEATLLGFAARKSRVATSMLRLGCVLGVMGVFLTVYFRNILDVWGCLLLATSLLCYLYSRFLKLKTICAQC